MKPLRTPAGRPAAATRIPPAVRRKLRHFYERNGYVRFQLADRVERDGSQIYKKGDEVRLVANNADELELMRSLLLEAGFQPGRPFAAARKYRLPIYGRDAVVRFMAMIRRRKPRRTTTV